MVAVAIFGLVADEPTRSGMDPTVAAIIAAIGGLFSAGGLLAKLIEWLRERSNKTIEADTSLEVKKIEADTSLEAKKIDAEVTINSQHLKRITDLELRNTELARANDVHQNEKVDLASKVIDMRGVVGERDRTIAELRRQVADLTAASSALARDNEMLRSDKSALEMAKRDSDRENLRLRAELEAREERKGARGG
jgi:hypothetical protein